MDEELVDAVVQLSYAVVGELGEVAAAHDLSLTQLRLLAILTDRTPRMAAVAEHLGLDRSSVSGLVDRAEQRGLVERYADPDDGRASRVRLTRRGRALATRLRGEVTPRIDAVLAGLGAADRRTLTRLVRRVLPG